MEIEDGFKIEVVASEPLVIAPTVMTFDEKGRMWIVEMPSFMVDTLGTGEEQPTGKIVILEDEDQDGKFDTRKVFMDSLVLPRAISLFSDGILIAAPPYLWFVPIKDDRPGEKIVVDDKYAIGGNVEHQPNGLLRALDNWIYNAKSDKRYRRVGDKWLIEKTHFRGQWGIAQDNYGRLFYNHNSANVLGDYFSPGFGATNNNQRKVDGFNEEIVNDKRVYPIRPTTGVNRGYMDGILDSTSRLVNFTAASALTIYRGDLFGEEFYFNAFVPEPAANLIKRNILQEEGNTITGRQAYEGSEFLRSTDERFRPVSLVNSPDGALYVVDMYRGIIQHKTYLTPYLKQEIVSRDLQQPTEMGRIYKITPRKGRKSKVVSFPDHAQGLVELLSHPNGWIRDKAQQLLIDRNMSDAVPHLRTLINNPGNALAAIHAMWTLEGLEKLGSEDINLLFSNDDRHIRVQALSAMISISDETNFEQFTPYLDKMIDDKDDLAAPYIAFFAAEKMKTFDVDESKRLIFKLLQTFPKNNFVADAIVSGLQDKEETFLSGLQAHDIKPESVIYEKLTKVLNDIEKAKNDVNTKAAAEKFPEGALLYNQFCATCHGKDGYGIESLAPPLNNSDWVLGNKDKLVAIVLHGLTGPITVNGTTLQFGADMPGIGQSEDFSDRAIAQTLSYVRNAWSNSASSISDQDVLKIRNKFADRKNPFTQKELDSIWKNKGR